MRLYSSPMSTALATVMLALLSVGEAVAGSSSALSAITSRAHVERMQAVGSVIQKVIDMLQDNKMKIIRDLEQEQKEMSEYAEFCDDESTDKGFNVKTASRKIQDLEATVEDNEAQIRSENEQVSKLGSEMAEMDREIAEQNEMRKKEHDEFSTSEKELLESIEEVESSIVVIKKQMDMINEAVNSAMGGGEAPAASAALLQNHNKGGNAATTANAVTTADGTSVITAMKAVNIVMNKLVHAAWVDNSSKEMLGDLAKQATKSGFLQQKGREEPAAESEGEGEGEGEGGDGMIETFEKMKVKAEQTLQDSRTKELNNKHNFDMAMNSLTHKMNVAQERLADSTGNRDEKKQALAKARGELVETEKTKGADETYLQTLTQECENTAQGWAAREKSAKGEMGAIDKAKEILTSRVKVFAQGAAVVVHTLHRDDPEEGAVVTASSPAGTGAEERALRHKLTDHFVELGHEFRSYAMMEMANAAASDPFEKIKRMIQDMVGKLIEEANAESSQKEFCDTENAKSKKDRDEKSSRLDKLKVRLDTASSGTADLQENIKTMMEEMHGIDKANAEGTKIRNEESTTNKKAAEDYSNGAQAVEDAIGVLQDYYQGVSFLQTPKPQSSALLQDTQKPKKAALLQGRQQAPNFKEAKSDSGDMIIGILENSAEEFSKMHMQILSAEGKAKKAYEKLTSENTISKASKNAEMKANKSEIKSLAVAMKNHKEDYGMTSKELDAVVAYLEKLKPQCQVKVITYEEKKARREQEIAGLKEAVGILDANAGSGQ